LTAAEGRRARSANVYTAVATAFGGDFYGLRRLAERDHGNIVRWRPTITAAISPPHKAPDLYVRDARQFFRVIGR